MPPDLALLVWLILVVALFWFDPAKEPQISAALWVPLTWIGLMASREPSQWLDGNNWMAGGALIAESFQEGNPLNRTISLLLLLLGIGILLSRSFRWGAFFSRNRVLTVYLVFALISVVWSDFPFAAFRKWSRDLTAYVMILVCLSEAQPIVAVGVLLRRLGYLLIPLSIVLIKYFPILARQYDPFTGAVTYCGATTSKNMLGELCLICGIFFFWDSVVRWPNHKRRRDRRIILMNLVMIGMAAWLLVTCNSATSQTCLIIGCLLILAAHTKAVQRRPAMLTVTVPVAFLLYALLFFGMGMSTQFAAIVGRTSLSGRTDIWQIVLGQHTNALVGTGYESFWLGPRLQRIWASGMGELNEAHNGYLEVYLNLGYTGLVLLLLLVAATYRDICRLFRPFSNIVSFTLAIWTAFLFHNCTEADFRSGLMWFSFLLAAVPLAMLGREAGGASVLGRSVRKTDRFQASLCDTGRVIQPAHR